MRSTLADEQIAQYDRDGFVVIDDFLDADELENWRAVFDDALAQRGTHRFRDESIAPDEDDADEPKDEHAAFYDRVFDQRVNLWQTNDRMRLLIHDPRIAEMAATLAGVEAIRSWHDQALVKRPYANPTAFHLDVPYWSFSARHAVSVWIALDDATEANGCLYFFAGSHHETTFDNVAIGENVGAIFDVYPQFAGRAAASGVMRAGSCSFHNGLTIHGAGANMTNGDRRAMTCAYMPDGATFNGQKNVLPASYFESLAVGDVLDDSAHVPLLWQKH